MQVDYEFGLLGLQRPLDVMLVTTSEANERITTPTTARIRQFTFESRYFAQLLSRGMSTVFSLAMERCLCPLLLYATFELLSHFTQLLSLCESLLYATFEPRLLACMRPGPPSRNGLNEAGP